MYIHVVHIHVHVHIQVPPCIKSTVSNILIRFICSLTTSRSNLPGVCVLLD